MDFRVHQGRSVDSGRKLGLNTLLHHGIFPKLWKEAGYDVRFKLHGIL